MVVTVESLDVTFWTDRLSIQFQNKFCRAMRTGVVYLMFNRWMSSKYKIKTKSLVLSLWFGYVIRINTPFDDGRHNVPRGIFQVGIIHWWWMGFVRLICGLIKVQFIFKLCLIFNVLEKLPTLSHKLTHLLVNACSHPKDSYFVAHQMPQVPGSTSFSIHKIIQMQYFVKIIKTS